MGEEICIGNLFSLEGLLNKDQVVVQKEKNLNFFWGQTVSFLVTDYLEVALR